MIHTRQALENLGCHWCDRGAARICFENPGVNPLHLDGNKLFKCCVPDIVYETERYEEEK